MLENKPREFYRCLPLQRRDCLVNPVDVASHDLSIDGTQTRIVPNRLEAGNETELKLLRMRRGILFRTAAPYNGKHVKKRSFGFSSYRWSIESPPTEVAGLSWILIPVTVLYPYTLSDQGNIEFWQTSE